jgi:predicted TIM-barrel fold metal-dependent hydrolase
VADFAEYMARQVSAGKATRRDRVLIEDPAPRPVFLPLISVDDHLLEPPDMFRERLPAKYAEVTPRVVEDASGMEMWRFEDALVSISGGNAISSWAPEERTTLPVRFDEIRPAIYDVHQRVGDMDVNGMLASLCFPSMVFGFCGQRFAKFEDQDLGLAAMRAYNQWIIEEWVGPYPDRMIGQQVPWLLDAEVAAAEIRSNAALGFRAVTFSENPELLGLPSLYTECWDPFFRACEETGTVIDLHVGSSSQSIIPSLDSPPPVVTAMFSINAYSAAVDWVYSGIPVRFPGLKIVLSEGGIGWAMMLMDRLGFLASRFNPDNDGGMHSTWADPTITPLEVLRRNFYYASFFDPSAFRQLDAIGPDKVMLEVDYPHSDSTWPDTQDALAHQIGVLPERQRRLVAYENAAAVYRFELPTDHETFFSSTARSADASR